MSPLYQGLPSTKRLWTNKRTNKNENPTRHLNTALHHAMNENRNCKKNSRLLKAETQQTLILLAEPQQYEQRTTITPSIIVNFPIQKLILGETGNFTVHLWVDTYGQNIIVSNTPSTKTKAITSRSWPSIRCHKDFTGGTLRLTPSHRTPETRQKATSYLITLSFMHHTNITRNHGQHFNYIALFLHHYRSKVHAAQISLTF